MPTARLLYIFFFKFYGVYIMQFITALVFVLLVVQSVLFLLLDMYWISALFSVFGITFVIFVSFHGEL